MPERSYKDIIQSIQQRDFAPFYFLHGSEPYYIDKLTDLIEESVLPEAERSFNQIILYGQDAEGRTVADYARQFPMMSEKRVVIVKEAQSMKGLSDMASYFDSPNPSTILVLAYKHKKLDGRLAISKKIKASAVMMESKTLYDNQVEGWIANLLKEKGISFQSGVTGLLAEHIGNDLARIDTEVDKLSANLKEGQSVDPSLIEKYIGISKQYNVYELQRAMSEGNLKKVMRITDYFANNIKEVHPVMVTGALYNYFSRLLTVGMNKSLSDRELQAKLRLSSAFFLREYKAALRFWNGNKVLRAMQLLSEFDLKFKGVGSRSTSLPELLKEMIYRMMTA